MSGVPKKLESLLGKIAAEQNYDGEIEINPVTTNGASSTSALYSVTITDPKKKDLKLFAKIAALAEKMRIELSVVMPNIYDMEPFVYTSLADVFKRIEDKYEIPDEHRLVMTKIYGHDDTYLEETIVLHDLTGMGYTMQDRMEPVNWDYALQSIEELAKLHALSIAFQEEYPEEYKETLRLFTYRPPEQLAPELYADTFEALADKAVATVFEEHRRPLLAFLQKVADPEFRNAYLKTTHPVLNHGDFRISNIMHKVKDNGHYDMVLIDYQFVHVGSFMRDLLLMIMLCTDEEFRAKHFHQLFEHYYEQMCLALRRFKLDPEVLFPKADFDDEVEKNLTYGLIMALFYLPICMVDVDDKVPSGEMSVESAMEVPTNPVYVERIRGIVGDYVKWGLI